MREISFFPTAKNGSRTIAPEKNFPQILALTLELIQTLTPTRGNFLWGELSGHW